MRRSSGHQRADQDQVQRLPVPPFRYLPRSGGDARSTPGEIGYFRRNCLVPKVDSLPEVSARDEQAERSEGDHQVDARVRTKE